MRRAALIALALLGGALVIAWPARGGDGGDYKVRAFFDNGSFLVPDEEVRVAGATVGTIDSVDVSREDEVVSLEDGPRAIPGTAIIVLKIEDDGFKDFRADASCLIRPQSLIGEKFVDCTPTQPRAPGSPPPPELEEISEGERGEGQRLLPVENNGKSVDIDLVQNIMRYPYRERFRLILNELGAALAGRGEDLGEIVDRANPALRQTDRVLAILAQQNRQLADLAANGDAVLEPLARERESVTGFISNANVAAEATAERSDDLEAGLSKLPRTLREVRLTMKELQAFGRQGTPLFVDLNAVAPDLNRATQKLPAFARAATPALESLGDAADEVGPDLVAADDLIIDLRSAGRQLNPASKALKRFIDTFARTDGTRHLASAVYNVSAALNGYDSLGHVLRSNLLVTACAEYFDIPLPGCIANWGGVAPRTRVASAAGRQLERADLGATLQGLLPLESLDQLPEIDPEEPAEPAPPSDDEAGAETETEPAPDKAAETSARRAGGRRPLSPRSRQASMLLDFLLGSAG